MLQNFCVSPIAASWLFLAKSVCRFWIIASPNISLPCPKLSKSTAQPQKSFLRRAAQGRIPDKVLHRNDKKGFEVPEGAWLLGPLRRWAEGILNSSELRQRGWIDPAMAQQV
jgi:asparagine synthetase B (glutamine-hydrolysing)